MIAKKIDESASAFKRLVIPRMEERHSRAIDSWEQIENNDRRGGNTLDCKCGVDWLIHWHNSTVTPVEVRCQPGNYRTFTVRKRTARGNPSQFDKMQAAISKPRGFCIQPYWTIQAYFSANYEALLRFGVCPSRNLYSMDLGAYPHRTNRQDGAIFIAVPFNDVTDVYVHDELSYELQKKQPTFNFSQEDEQEHGPALFSGWMRENYT